MVLLMAFLCLALLVAVDVISIASNLNTVNGELDFSFRYQQPVADAFAPGAVVCIFILAVLCVVLPLLSLAWAFVAVLIAAGGIAMIQHFLLPFGTPAFTKLLMCLAVVAIAFLVVRAVIVSLHRRQVNKYLQQYVPPQLVSHYMQNQSAQPMVGESRDMTIMFCDIKHFTGISERLNPELLPDWLNRFFEIVSEIVVEHNGTIDKYIGDSVMAFWGAPQVSETHAQDALMAARKIIPAVAELSRQFATEDPAGNFH